MSKEFEKAVGGEAASVTAAHEAGHALLAYLSPAVESVKGTVWIREGEPGKTRVRVLYEHRRPATSYTIWETVIIAAAGIAAEALTHLRFTTGGARGDLEAMRQGAKAIRVMHGGSRAVAPWPDPPDAKVPPFDRYFKEAVDPADQAVIRKAYLRARSRIVEHRGAYERLRVALIAKIELDADEIAAALRLPKG